MKLIADDLDLVERVFRGIERWAERTGNSHGIKITHESLDMVHECQAGRATVGWAKMEKQTAFDAAGQRNECSWLVGYPEAICD